MYIVHVLASVLYTRASTCVYARARPLLAKMRPGWGGQGRGGQLLGGPGGQLVGGPGGQGVGGPPGDQEGFQAGHPAVLCRGMWALVRRT